MPRSGAFILDEMRSLAKQLAFIPAVAARRQLNASRELLVRIQAEELYGWNDVVWKITQFRIERSTKQSQARQGEPRVVGETLRRDLGELVLRLSRRAPEEFGEAWSMAQLAREWSVSERTIHRLRDRGLPSCWMRRASSNRSGSLMLAIRKVDAVAYRLVNEDALVRAAHVKRVTPFTRATILRRAGAMVVGGERRISLASRSIAKEVGVSTETVRALLVKTPEATGGRLAGRKDRNPGSETKVFALWCRGFGAAKIALAMRCSQPSADRLIHALRRRWLQTHAERFSPASVKIPTTFEREDAREVILGSEWVRSNLASAAPMRDGRLWLAAHAQDGSADPARLMAVRFLWWRARQDALLLPMTRASESKLDRIETDLRWARLLVRTLLMRSMPAIVTRLKLWGGGDATRIPPATLRRILAISAESLIGVLRESDPIHVASARVRVDRAVALSLERRLSSIAVPKLLPERILHEPIPMPDPIDTHLPWQGALEKLARRIDHIRASDPNRMLCWKRIGWTGECPMTVAELAIEERKPISAVARLIGQTIGGTIRG